MEILYGLPASAKLIEGAKYGDSRLGLEVSDFVTGATLTRNWSSSNRRVYDLKLIMENYVAGADEWAAFLRQTVVGSKPFIVTEPVRHAHVGLPVYPLPDGVRTSFAVPMVFNSELILYVDGVPVEVRRVSSGYDVPLNALSHEQATASPFSGGDLTGVWDKTLLAGDFYAQAGAGLVGPRCVMIEIYTPDTGAGVITPERVSVGNMAAAGDPMKGGCWIQAEGTFEARLKLWRVNGDLIADETTAVLCDPSEWTLVEVECPTPTSTPYEAELSVQQSLTGSGIILMDAFYISPIGADYWVDPSNGFTPVQFSTPPAETAVLTAGGYGRRSSLVTAAKNTASWQPLATGRAVPDGLRVVEELPGVRGETP